ncbi:PREDICTED: uncharacterized protein LOC107165788 [Diuraphis noxia]|uniref:uncharacterized protein LOC107165788 n=1 Tax=Diuraphis noxia TaxID=143948 RepID=UPI0007638AA3|nr:PREDICTED: uncharacterized protein LOC107165788 [Diuraphis noxia]XP_015369668.1 PREDICTED: uncharacterized protein LOC107165788 [Diuraphis noxia]
MSCKRDTMADIMVHSADNSPRREVYRCGMLSPVLGPRSSFRMNSELKHSRSDDLILQGAPYTPPDMQHGISDAAFQIQKDACVVYDDEVNDHRISVACYESPIVAPESDSTPLLKLTGDFSSEGANKRCSVIDRIDPEDSIGDIISQNDFYRFVLFKRHYEKYLDISRKYEEARSLAYYLEEKYHEIKAERDSLIDTHHELEKQLVTRDLELHEKEEELFLQLEKVIRLEEDCEKLRNEKDKMVKWKDRLEREKNEAYRQLRLQAESSENTRRNLERARLDAYRQFSEIAAEKDNLEKENSRLKEVLEDLGRKADLYHTNSKQASQKAKRVSGLEREVNELKLMAKQSATLNSQLQKGMKHLATCRRKKCSVCSYTRATFGEYTSSRHGEKTSRFIGGCFPLDELRRSSDRMSTSDLEHECAKLAERLSACSFPHTPPSTPERSVASGSLSRFVSYIDDAFSSASDDDDVCGEIGGRTAKGTGSGSRRQFSSDSGISSSSATPTDPNKLTPTCGGGGHRPSSTTSFNRSAKWTSSFRKLIRRVSTKKHVDESQ